MPLWAETPTHSFDLVIMVDWSGSSSRGPARPSPDRCWLAHARRTTDGAARRPDPEYFRTRLDCERRLGELLRAHPARALVGFDFPIGYPTHAQGRPVLPTGRALCALLDSLITDHPSGANTRFEAAAELNRRVARETGAPEGPFWGCPQRAAVADLTPTKARRAPVHEFRAVEHLLRRQGRNIQSAWKLMGIGSVGSQSLLGLPVVHRLLESLAPRTTLWPFDPPTGADDEIVFAEIWPSLGNADAYDHPIKDARQVLAMRDAALDAGLDAGLPLDAPDIAQTEGWILGVPAPPAELWA